MVMADIFSRMATITLASSKMIITRVKESLLNLMERSKKVDTQMINSWVSMLNER